MKHPRTHRWFRKPDDAHDRRRDDAPPPLIARIPDGDPPSTEDLDAAVAEALRGWPVVRLRLVGETRCKVPFGRNPGPRLHGMVAGAVDRKFCTCGPRCTRRACRSHQLLGRHEIGPGSGIGDPWAPVALRVADATKGKTDVGAATRIGLVLAGRAAEKANHFVDALLEDDGGEVAWRSAQYMLSEEGNDPRWKNAAGVEAEAMRLPLDRIDEPSLRRGRLTWAFRSPTTLARNAEIGTPSADFPLVLDRGGRSLATWMHRTGHRGPRLPGDDLLRAARVIETAADHTRIIELASRSVGGVAEGPDAVGALLGSVTWKGDFGPFARLLRALHYVGMGPARAHGFGEVEIG